MKLLPAPLLSLSLLALWVMLQGSVDPGTVMLGALVAIMVPLMTQTLRPTRVRMRRPGKVLLLIGRVFVDVIRSNFEVAWHVWFFRSHPPRTQWVVIPLQLRTPAGSAVSHCRHRARHGVERAVDGPQPAAVPCLSRSGRPGLCGLVQGTL